MKATQEQYNQCIDLYNTGGPSLIYDYAVRNGIDSWSLCDACDTDTPDTHDSCCLVCGSKKE